MPIYKLDGKKDGLQKYRVIVSYTDGIEEYKQVARVAYGTKAASDMEEALRREYVNQVPAARITLRELIYEQLESKKQEVRATSYDKSKGILERHVIPYIGDLRLDRLNAQALNKWKLKIGETDLAISMKKNIFKELNTVLNWAARFDRIPSNPLKKVGNFREVLFEKPADVLRFYKPDEFLLFIRAAEDHAAERNDWRFYTFFMIAFYTGMRKGEINALKWSDIEGNTIHVRRSIAQKQKGGDVETPPKNKSSYRDLQIPRPLMDALAAQKKRQMLYHSFTEDFRVCGGPAVLRDSTIEYRNKQYSHKAALEHIRIHDFRHSHASVLVNNGIVIKEVSRRLGHSNVQITWNLYSHLYPKEEERAVSVLDSIVPKNKN